MRPWVERLAYFQAYTVAHPALIAAKEKLLAAIYDSAPNSLILVLGPTGVGKTTLRLKIEQMLAQNLSSELASDPMRVPVVSLETVAPDSGVFNWRDHFRRLLLSMQEPLVPYKMDPDRKTGGTLIRPFRPGTQPSSADYQHAVEQALRHRRPAAVLIDEAQHLAKVPSGRRLADQLDVIKSIASHTGTVHVLFGTYDLLAFRNLSAQLSRRCFDIHFRRYQLGDEKRTFLGVLRSFEQNLPLPESPDLLKDWDYLYERSLGCIGILKEWLNRALAATARQGGRKLTRDALDGCALSVSQCDRMVAEILEGERQMTERREQVCSLRVRLGLEIHQREEGPSAPVPLPAADARPPKRSPRPGKRRPARDRIGVATALGELLDASPQLPEGLMRTAFRENMQGLVDRFAAGNAYAFAQGLSLNYSVLDGWLKGESVACLDGLLKLAEKLNIAPINLITPESALGSIDIERMEKTMRDGPGHRKLFPNAAEIRRELLEASKQVPPPALTRLAHKLGFQDVARLYQVDAQLCKLIAKNHRHSPDTYWWRHRGAKPICTIEEMRDALETVLAEDNPTSTKHLSKRLGYSDDRLMRNRFPDLCAAVTAKRREWKASLPARIQPAIEKALAEAPPPSLIQIARRLGFRTLLTLNKYCPTLNQELSSRQEAYRCARDCQRREALEQALTENPTPCVADVAKRLRISTAVLRAKFYNLCADLGERYRMRSTAKTRE